MVEDAADEIFGLSEVNSDYFMVDFNVRISVFFHKYLYGHMISSPPRFLSCVASYI